MLIILLILVIIIFYRWITKLSSKKYILNVKHNLFKIQLIFRKNNIE